MRPMIIQCENCQTKFKIPDGAIGEDGRFVRCSQCEYEWLQKPEDSNIHAADVQEEDEVELEASSPKARKIEESPSAMVAFINSGWALYSCIALFLLSLTFLTIVCGLTLRVQLERTLPATRAIFENFGPNNVDGLELSDMVIKTREKLKRSDGGKKQEMTVIVGVHNLSEQPKNMEMVRFAVFDKNWEKLSHYDFPQDINVSAKGFETITANLKEVPVDAIYLSVEIGNKIDINLQELNKMMIESSKKEKS